MPTPNFIANRVPAWVLLVMLMASGCMSMRHQQIVPESVATCHQLARDGISAMEMGDYNQACQLLENAVKVSPTDIESRRQLVQALWSMGHQQEAIVHMEAAIRLEPDHAPTLVRFGEMLLVSGNLDRAFEQAEQAISLDPSMAAVWQLRGRIYHQRDQLPRALADLQQALRHEPQNTDLLLEVAEIQYQLQRPQQSLATLHHLLDHSPSGAEPQRVLWLQGLAYNKLERPQDAVTSLMAAAERGPARANLLYALAQAEVSLGRPEAAAKSVRQALALDQDHQASRTLLAQLQHAGGATEGAVLRR